MAGCGDAGRGLEDGGLRHRQVREGHAGGGGCHADESDERGGGRLKVTEAADIVLSLLRSADFESGALGSGVAIYKNGEQLENGD